MKGQQLNASIIAQTRLTSTEEFGKILLKVNQDGSRVLLRDVAKIELGGENYDIIAEFNVCGFRSGDQAGSRCKRAGYRCGNPC